MILTKLDVVHVNSKHEVFENMKTENRTKSSDRFRLVPLVKLNVRAASLKLP